MKMSKQSYLAPEVEVFVLPRGLQVLANLSLDGQVEDYEGAEIEGF